MIASGRHQKSSRPPSYCYAIVSRLREPILMVDNKTQPTDASVDAYLDENVLEQLIAGSVAELERRYGSTSDT